MIPSFLQAHLSSSLGLYSGFLFLILSVVLTRFDTNRYVFYTERISFILGATLILASAIPVPFPVLIVLAILLLGWRFFQNSEWETEWPLAPFTGGVLLTCLLALVAWDATYLGTPEISEQPPETVVIVGDSLTVPIRDSITAWPKQLQSRGYPIKKITRPGIGLNRANRMVRQAEWPEGSVTTLVLVGGNDILRGTNRTQFRTQLNRLLLGLSERSNRIVMFELPLPPLHGNYGWIQRNLARQHNVDLIHRRILAGVLFSNETTMDGIHLRQAGHNRLRKYITSWLQPPSR